MRDLLWSDPIEDFDQGRTAVMFVHSPRRGNSYVYTFKAVDDFLERNSLLSIIRAHEMHNDGHVESFYISPEVLVDSSCV